jgi:hypothetical protein
MEERERLSDLEYRLPPVSYKSAQIMLSDYSGSGETQQQVRQTSLEMVNYNQPVNARNDRSHTTRNCQSPVSSIPILTSNNFFNRKQ